MFRVPISSTGLEPIGKPHAPEVTRKRTLIEMSESGEDGHSKRLKYDREREDEEDVWSSYGINSDAASDCISVFNWSRWR